MNKWKLIVISIIVTAFCFYVSVLLYPTAHPLGATQFTVNKDHIVKNASDLLSDLGLLARGLKADIRLRAQKHLIKQIQEEKGLEKGNRLLRESYPGYYWDLVWIEKPYTGISIETDDESPQVDEKIQEILKGTRFHFDTHGRMLHFSRKIPDTLNLPILSKSEAKKLAYDFIKKYVEFKPLENETIPSDSLGGMPNELKESEDDELEQVQSRIGERFKRTDYTFKWLISLPELENKSELKVIIAGNLISNYDLDLHVPEKYQHDEDSIVREILNVLLFIFITIIVIVIAFRKSRAYEINFTIAWKLGIFIALLYAVEVYFMMSREQGWEMIIPMIILPGFVGGAFIFAWAVSESVGRETWKEKIIPLDLITKGHFFHSKIGTGILTGISFGAVTVLVFLVLTWVASKIYSIYTIDSQSNLDYFSSINPTLKLLIHSLWSNLYVLSIYCMLLVSILYSKTGSRNITLALTAIPLAIMMGGIIGPSYIAIIIEAFTFGILLWVFYRYDLLTTFTALVTFTILYASITFANALNTEFIEIAAQHLTVLTAIIVIYAWITIFSKDKVQDFSAIEPAIAKFISERQRMKQQLEVAREVQKTFLPQSYPIFKGLDLAAECVPAFEVGGDYYDFIKLGNHRLGVVIGDVSGKGTRAAFYMTLVKGFLRALARISYSPAEILKEMNTLFFENAKRDAFISLVYGIFDMEEKILTLARSGHNPVIVHRTGEERLETIITDGLALGLEKGALFNRIMQETKIPIKSGDLFVFYTDGFTDARNKSKEEFGEERFLAAIKKYADGSAEKVLQGIFTEVKRYSKGMQQHDDMSMVVVKVI